LGPFYELNVDEEFSEHQTVRRVVRLETYGGLHLALGLVPSIFCKGKRFPVKCVITSDLRIEVGSTREKGQSLFVLAVGKQASPMFEFLAGAFGVEQIALDLYLHRFVGLQFLVGDLTAQLVVVLNTALRVAQGFMCLCEF